MSFKHYMSLRYPHELTPWEDGYFSSHPDLPGCMASGATVEQALENLDDARELWIEARMESGYPVPEPATRLVEED